VKLIRSKGIGLFFVTQNPNDVPEAVLGQLGLKVQHALRAFTANDRKAIKLAAENYPDSEYYDVDEVLTQMGIGEAFVSVLNEKGIPTPLACTMMRAPMSRMDVLTDNELKQLISSSRIYHKYNEVIDSESAYEILNEKIERIYEMEDVENRKREEMDDSKKSRERTSTRMNPILKVVTSASFIRGVLGILKRAM
jgi:DNA helicase HerA-like ATPase